MTLVLRYSARSDRGLVRQNNQDAVYAGPRLLALADGMGGHAAGEVASSLVISALAPLDDDDPGDDLLRELRAATVEGNAAIQRHVLEAPDLEGMGTTLTAILFKGSRLGLVHVGDSRAYQLREGVFTQITKDDTFVQSLIDEGRITEEEAHTHPQRSLLLRAMTGQDIDPSLTVREARPGDRYPLRGGGPDNITCIVADVVDVDFGDDAPIVGGAAGDGRDITPPPDSAAARASATTLTRTAPLRVHPVAPAPAARFRGLRLALGIVAVLAVLAGGGVLARMWVLQQYYVGAEQQHVAIFQGVRGSVLGLPLQHLVEQTDIALTDLPEATRNTVQDGILVTEGGLAGAQAKVGLLRGNMLAPCPVPGLASPSAALVPPTPQVLPTDPAALPTDPSQAVPPTDPNLAAVPSVDTTPLPTVAPEPGLNCRPVS